MQGSRKWKASKFHIIYEYKRGCHDSRAWNGIFPKDNPDVLACH